MLKIWFITVKTLGEFIKSERVARDMNTSEFARFVDISHQVVGKFEKAKSIEESGFPSIETLLKLSRATGTSLASLVMLLVPEQERADLSPQAQIFAEQFDKLSDQDRQTLEVIVAGFMRKNIDKLRDKV